MIPFLPLDTNPMDVPVFYRQIAENLEMRLGHHEGWHTHKRDPSVCPICDCIELSKLVIGEMERYISKSAVELSEQLLSQDISSEGDKVISSSSDEDVDGV